MHKELKRVTKEKIQITKSHKNTKHYLVSSGLKHKLFKLRGAFNKFPDFFVQAFKIVADS